MADRYGYGGLADATDADNVDEAVSDQMIRYAQNILVASDHVHDAARQIGMRKFRCYRGRRLDFTTRTRNPCHETISASGQCRDVPRTVFSVAERLAQARHVKAQAAFFDRDVGPDARQ